MEAGPSDVMAWLDEGLLKPLESIFYEGPPTYSWKNVHWWLQRHAWVFLYPSNEQCSTLQCCCRCCSSLAVQEAAFAALQGHRDHKALVYLAFPAAGAVEPVKGVLGVTGASTSNVVQRSSACAVLALLSALSPALQAPSDLKLITVHTISVALLHLLHYCFVVQACSNTAANRNQSSPEVVARHTPAQLVAPARVDSAGAGLTGRGAAQDGQALIQKVSSIAQQELLAMVRGVMRATDELDTSAVAVANALCLCLAIFCERFDAAASKATATIIRSGGSFAILLFFICALVETLKCWAGAEDLIRLLAIKQLRMPQLLLKMSELDTVYPTYSGAMYLALQLVRQEIRGSTPMERSFRALCRHHNVHTNLETMLPRYSFGGHFEILMLPCALRLLAVFAVQLPGQDTPVLPGAEAYGNAAVAYFDAGDFEPSALGEACTAACDTQKCRACPTDMLWPLL